MKEDWSSHQHYFLKPGLRGLYRVRYRTSPATRAKVFRHTVHDCRLSLVYLHRMYSVLVILPKPVFGQKNAYKVSFFGNTEGIFMELTDIPVPGTYEQCFESGFNKYGSGYGHFAESGSRLLLNPDPIRIRFQTKAI
jgi:hypothetical protein